MAMRMQNIRMSTTVSKAQLLETLKANLAKHKEQVAAATAGYIEKAKAEANKIIAQLRKGNPVVVRSSLVIPTDHSEVYENSIRMLEWNVDETITLEADEFRQLVRDEWDWSCHFNALVSDYTGQFGGKARKTSDEDEAVGGAPPA
jgi:hypothetical protein